MSDRPKFSNMDEYIAAAPAEVRRILEDIRQVVQGLCTLRTRRHAACRALAECAGCVDGIG